MEKTKTKDMFFFHFSNMPYAIPWYNSTWEPWQLKKQVLSYYIATQILGKKQKTWKITNHNFIYLFLTMGRNKQPYWNKNKRPRQQQGKKSSIGDNKEVDGRKKRVCTDDEDDNDKYDYD